MANLTRKSSGQAWDAVFIPPHYQELPGLLTDLEKYWHNNDLKIPPLIKAAVSHYQFETIHPFLDGNGRIGRLIITLYLVDQKILHRPVLYLSDFFEKNRASYYDSLSMVRRTNDISQWIKFFLSGVTETSDSSKSTFDSVLKLREECNSKVMKMGKRAPNALKLLQLLFSKPVMEIATVSRKLEISDTAASNLIEQFIKNKILEEITGFKRNRLFAFSSYVKIFK